MSNCVKHGVCVLGEVVSNCVKHGVCVLEKKLLATIAALIGEIDRITLVLV